MVCYQVDECCAQAASNECESSASEPDPKTNNMPSAETQVAKRGRPPDDAVLKASKKLHRAQKAYNNAHLELFEKRDTIFSKGALYDAPSIVERTKRAHRGGGAECGGSRGSVRGEPE